MNKPYRVVNLTQGSLDWLQWRKRGLGASTAPIIMGASPWCTRYQLWMQLTGRAPEFSGNWATERGQLLEPKARASYQLMSDMDLPSMCVEMIEYPWIKASLDGFNEEAGVILEIKAPGRDDHKLAKEGSVPAKYIWQLEHQLFVTGAKEVHYVSFYKDKKTGKEDRALVVYKSCDMRRESLFKELRAFWDFVERDCPPQLTKDDIIELDDQQAVFLASEIKIRKRREIGLSKRLKEVNDELEELKIKLRKLNDHPKITCCGVSLTRVVAGDRVYDQLRLIDEGPSL